MRQTEIEDLLQASTHHVRYWVENLKPLRSKPRKPRSPTDYTAQEVLFLAVVSMLHSAGVTWEQLVPISDAMFQLLRRPQLIGKDDVLILWKTPSGWEFVARPDPRCVSVSVPVFVARELVRKKMDDAVLHLQRDLNFGMAAVQRSRAASR